MGFNRIEAKFRAKTSIRQARPSPMRVTLVFLLLTSLLSTLVRYLTFAPMEIIDYFYYYQGSYSPEMIWAYIWNTYANQILTYLGISFVLGIYTTVMNFGYTSYALRLSRNEEPELTHIFDGFVKVWRVLWMSFLKVLFVLLWTILGALPGYGAIFAYIMLAGESTDPYSLAMSVNGLIMLTVALMVVACLVAGYRYCLAEYFLLDDPSRKARECIRLSKKAMAGWKMERFTLDFSFAGWYICGWFLTTVLSQVWFAAGVVGMLGFNAWFLPYYSATKANFYNSIIGRADPFSKGSDWEDRMKDFNDALDKPGF